MSYQDILQILLAHPRLRLFLDYDGTLADFRDSPDQVDAQPEVINLLEYLRDCGKIKLVILSGRWLTHLPPSTTCLGR